MKLTNKLVDQYLKEKLSTNATWAQACMLRIFERQTVIEKAINATNVENDIGFSGADAEICSSFAKQLLQKRILSTKQMAIVFKKAKKYRKQLLSITDKDKLFTCMIKDGVITQGDLVVWKEKEKGKWFLKAL